MIFIYAVFFNDYFLKIFLYYKNLFQQASAVEVYKIQIEEQEKDTLEMFDTERNYLEQIEKLTNENRELREENERLKN